MIVTRDRALADKIDVLRRFGGSTRYRHDRLGYNSRLDELQAAVLRVKLRHLRRWNERRRQIAALYGRLLAGLPVVLPHEGREAVHVYQEYTIRSERRDALQAFLRARGIETAVYYPLRCTCRSSTGTWAWAGQLSRSGASRYRGPFSAHLPRDGRR